MDLSGFALQQEQINIAAPTFSLTLCVSVFFLFKILQFSEEIFFSVESCLLLEEFFRGNGSTLFAWQQPSRSH